MRFASDRPSAPAPRHHSAPPTAPTHGYGPPAWWSDLGPVVEQEPMVLAKPSRDGVMRVGPRPPRPDVVAMGIGLCTPHALSRGLPVDVLGMLLPAEMARRALGASRLLVLVADEHARTNPFPDAQIEARARITVRTLARIKKRLGLDRLQVVRAESFHRRRAFRALHAEIQANAPRTTPEYVTRQVADLAYLTDQVGSVLKVGWTIDGSRSSGRRDEPAFDELLEPWSGRRAAFMYCRAGRALDARQTKVVPYICPDPSKRVQLHPDEDVKKKLSRAQDRLPPQTVREMKNHLKRIANTYGRVVEPVRGPLEARVQAMIGQLYGPR